MVDSTPQPKPDFDTLKLLLQRSVTRALKPGFDEEIDAINEQLRDRGFSEPDIETVSDFARDVHLKHLLAAIMTPVLGDIPADPNLDAVMQTMGLNQLSWYDNRGTKTFSYTGKFDFSLYEKMIEAKQQGIPIFCSPPSASLSQVFKMDPTPETLNQVVHAHTLAYAPIAAAQGLAKAFQLEGEEKEKLLTEAEGEARSVLTACEHWLLGISTAKRKAHDPNYKIPFELPDDPILGPIASAQASLQTDGSPASRKQVPKQREAISERVVPGGHVERHLKKQTASQGTQHVSDGAEFLPAASRKLAITHFSDLFPSSHAQLGGISN